MSTATLPSYLIPGDYIADTWRGEELRHDDRKLYGRSTEADRQEMLNRINKARGLSDRDREALRHAQVDARIAHSYVWGILDTIRPAITQAQFEVVMTVMWNFSNEVEYAAYMFHSEQATGHYGYALAWTTFLRYQPDVRMILDRVTVAPRPL